MSALKHLIRVLAKLFVGVLACGSAAFAADEPIAPAAAANFTPQQIVETWGWLMARRCGVAGIEINPEELSVFVKGFASGITNQPLPYDSAKIFPDVERLSKERRAKIVRATESKNEAEAKVFFDALKKQTNAVELPGGVYWDTIKPGRGSSPKMQQTINVHYTGRLIDGTEFAQYGPIDLVFVTNRSVCPGWIEGVQRMRTGGAIRLYIPPPLSEAEAVRWGIAPGSARVFEIELLELHDTSPEDLTNALLAPAPEPEPPPPSGFTVMQAFEAWGWDVARQTHGDKYQWSDAERTAMVKGLVAGILSRPPPSDLRAIYPLVNQFVNDRREQARLQVKHQRQAEMETLFATLKKSNNVVELPDGLRYEISKPGRGPHPKVGQIVLVDYTGRLIDGTVFDRTYNEPLHIEVGSVIPGWNEGIQKISKGGRIKLYIPPSLGYGDEDSSGVVAPIPADSVLIYEIELLEVQDAPK